MAEFVYAKTGDVKSPSRGHAEDAGIDVYVPDNFGERTIYPHEDILIDTCLKVAVPSGYAWVAMNKSGLCTKTGLIVGAAVIDSGYTGDVHVHLINTSDQPVTVIGGQKITQFLLIPVAVCDPTQISLENYMKNFGDSARADGGFGSTGV
jgi:dUTP pyrophosphatase